MSIEQIESIAAQAKDALAHPDRRYPLHVGLAAEAFVEAAREISEMRAQLGAAMDVVNAARGLSRCSPGVDVEEVSDAAGRVDAEARRLAEANITIDDLRDEIERRKASEEDTRKMWLRADQSLRDERREHEQMVEVLEGRIHAQSREIHEAFNVLETIDPSISRQCPLDVVTQEVITKIKQDISYAERAREELREIDVLIDGVLGPDDMPVRERVQTLITRNRRHIQEGDQWFTQVHEANKALDRAGIQPAPVLSKRISWATTQDCPQCRR